MNRRNFITSTAGTMAAGAAAGIHTASAADSAKGPLVKSNSVILFQGDSITDADRSREEANQPNNQKALGKDYAWLAASKLLVDRPADSIKIFNRGISRHKVPQLADRWQANCIDLKPDVLSILIGVNDNCFPEFDAYRAAAKKVAGTFQATFVPFQTMFDEAAKLTPPEHWANDGVHPSSFGASMMAHNWLKALGA